MSSTMALLLHKLLSPEAHWLSSSAPIWKRGPSVLAVCWLCFLHSTWEASPLCLACSSWKKLHEVYAQLGEAAQRREEGRKNNRHERDRREVPEARCGREFVDL